ncbi:cell cycle control protein [Hysterangium stoloniferum]|nr:cell cycle control protein [Hysterangium stoloniferum]
MAIFKRRTNSQEESNGDGENSSEGKKQKGGWRKPANTAFKQQRLKAWQPILTPKTVLPTLFIIGILFAPIGGLLIWGNSTVTQITLPYTNCENQGSDFSDLPNSEYLLRSSDSKVPITSPQWLFDNSTGTPTCVIQFDVPADLQHPVFIYYKLTNFFQNHRRYVQSFNTDQLKGKAVSKSTLDSSTCKPLASTGDKIIYPCGLIANSQFNDTIASPINLNLSGGGEAAFYNFTSQGIAWPGEKKKYAAVPGNNLSELVPPPNWHDRFPDGYANTSVVPDLSSDEHFQNWMRTAGLPTFSKLWGRNDSTDMVKGRYNISVELRYPVTEFGGTKSIVISTIAWTGGKNAFLGWAYVGASGLFVLLATIGTIRHLIKPRRLGDMNLLSWNQPGAPR